MEVDNSFVPDSNPGSPDAQQDLNELYYDDLPEPVFEIELDQDQHYPSDEDSDVQSLLIENEAVQAQPEERENPLYPEYSLNNYPRDTELPDDVTNGWRKTEPDEATSIPLLPHLVDACRLNMLEDGRKPENFFQALFDDSMWSKITDNTNEYAAKRKQLLGEDIIEQLQHPNYKKFARLNDWKTVSEAEMKVFVAHLIVMGVVRKAQIEKYWAKSGVGQTPFFGRWMSRNRFTAILANLHIVDDSQNPPFPQPGHDPLAKVRPFVVMCQENMKFTYKPAQDLSMDESCCPWKGRLRFKQYNPRKPARFHIKLFQMCEAQSGYILGFRIYTGKGSCVDPALCIDRDCTITTQTVITLANDCDLLDKGHRLYFDNYYSSPELLEELLYRTTSACGTVRSNRKGLPEAVTKAKLNKGECCFRRSESADEPGQPGPILALKWCDKRAVYMISTIHCATDKWTGKKDRTADKNPIYKPAVIVDYIERMGGVDLSDQLMVYYSFLRRTCKWWRKLWVHLLNMLILDAHILNKKFGDTKLSHSDFREHLAAWLIQCATGEPINVDEMTASIAVDRLSGRHFPQRLPARPDGRVVPLNCKVCFVGKKEADNTGKEKRRKSSSFKCEQCNIVMCVDPCFRLYHLYEKPKDYLDI